jgi:hypothetical protein
MRISKYSGKWPLALTHMLEDSAEAILAVDVPICTLVQSSVRTCKFDNLLAMVFDLANGGNVFPRSEFVE